MSAIVNAFVCWGMTASIATTKSMRIWRISSSVAQRLPRPGSVEPSVYIVRPRESSFDGHFQLWHTNLQQLEYGISWCNVVMYVGVCFRRHVLCKHVLMCEVVAFLAFSWPFERNVWICFAIFEDVLAPVLVVEFLRALIVFHIKHHCHWTGRMACLVVRKVPDTRSAD